MLDDERFLKAALDAAYGGEFNFWKYIYDRIDGQMPKPEELASDLEELNKVIEEAEAEYHRSQVGGDSPGSMS